MTDLNRASLASFGQSIAKFSYDRDRLRPGIVHFGVGNFHRVHQAVAVETCLHHSNQDGWAICGVSVSDTQQARIKAQSYRRQDNLFTVNTLVSPGEYESRIIGAMVEYLHAPNDQKAVLARLSDSTTRIVSLTITEGGYNLDETTGAFRLNTPDIQRDLAGHEPCTVFGYIVSALNSRRKAGLPPFTVMSCDNLQRNGDTSKLCIVSFADAVDPDLAKWIENEGAFPNSMVDRIAPQVSDADRKRIATVTGIDDLLPATCEPYTSWVLEDRFCAGRPALEEAGVVFSNEVPAHVAVKGRLSNAAHMLMCYPALLMGLRFVDEGMRQPDIPRLLRNFWDLDAYRLVTPPSGFSVRAFTEKVLERFANPAIGDQLLRVAGDGASKIAVFHGKTIEQLVATGGDLTREAFLIACFARYLTGFDDSGQPLNIFEPRVSETERNRLSAGDPLAVMDIDAFRGLSLGESPVFRSELRKLSEQLYAQGAAATLSSLVI
jgi:mannitol 2-dehydrogenase/sorbose reductase